MISKTALAEPNEAVSSAGPSLRRADVRRLNAATHKRVASLGAVRAQVGFFRCPRPCTKAQYERVRKAAVDKWVGYMERTGWVLVSEVHCWPSKARVATRMSGDWYSLTAPDEVEVPVMARFKKLDMQIVRVEVPVADD